MTNLRDRILRVVFAVPPSCAFEYAVTNIHLRLELTHAQGRMVVGIWEKTMYVRVEGHRPIGAPTVDVAIESNILRLNVERSVRLGVVAFTGTAVASGASDFAIPCIENADRIFAAVVAAQVSP